VRRWIAFAAVLAASLAVGLSAAQAAFALAPGVFVNPNSPAGKEYSFPLGVLRGQGAGRPASGRATAPLFGVGIASGSGTQGGQSNSSGVARANSSGVIGADSSGIVGQRGSPNGGGRPSGGASRSGELGGASPQSEAAIARIAAPGSSLSTTVLIVTAVLVTGLALGVGLRLLTRRS
jgi:hypothetical protein